MTWITTVFVLKNFGTNVYYDEFFDLDNHSLKNIGMIVNCIYFVTFVLTWITTVRMFFAQSECIMPNASQPVLFQN